MSLSTVRHLLYKELNWVIRAGTKTGQKLALTWEADCEKCFFRISYTVAQEGVHESMIINID